MGNAEKIELPVIVFETDEARSTPTKEVKKPVTKKMLLDVSHISKMSLRKYDTKKEYPQSDWCAFFEGSDIGRVIIIGDSLENVKNKLISLSIIKVL